MADGGRVLLVTGASRGIGAACARLAGSRGYVVAVNYARDAASAARVVAAIEAAGGRAAAFQADAGADQQITGLFDAVEARFGPITDVVNNAGATGPASTLAEASPATIRSVVDLNVTGAILVAREAVRRMSTARGGKGGAIVNISSMAPQIGSAGEFVWYAASKGAIDALTLGLAREVAREGIRVNQVAPGLIDTDIHVTGGLPDRLERLSPLIPMGRPGTPEEVAEAVLWLLSDAASYVTAGSIRISGGR